MAVFSSEQILLFQSLFRGREDVFAIRWEKEGKSGYSPAYDFNWEDFSIHKASGGTLKDFPGKQYLKLTEPRILNHLGGKEILGIYPLLEDNTSWFITADFDEAISGKKTWMEECRQLLDACNKLQIPAYLERSRSGNGGHVWVFFTAAYPAYKSRKIMLHILETAGIISLLDKNTNYDRLFPNQDKHSGKGLGNLIALPLQQKALENNNSCFIDPTTLAPFDDQWSFFKNIIRVNIELLDAIFNTIETPTPDIDHLKEQPVSTQNGIPIVLNNQIELPKQALPGGLIQFLRDQLNLVNSEYIIKKKLGKSTFGTEPYFKMLEEKAGVVLLPKGFIGKLLRFCIKQNIRYQLIDERKKLTEVNFNFKAVLSDHQQQAVDITDKKEMGIIVAPPGSGKTIMGLAIAANKKQPTLIIVHRRQLFDQWVEQIQSFLGIAEAFIGKISSGHYKIGTHITVAMIQSLTSIDEADEIFRSFGMIIVDECHHVPAISFRKVMQHFCSYYLYGLTATPIRKNNDEKLIFLNIGEVIYEAKPQADPSGSQKKISVTIRETDLFVPFDYLIDKPEMLSRIIIHDTKRNQLIIDDIKSEAGSGRKILVLTERRSHIEILNQYLKSNYEVIAVSGEDSESARKFKLNTIREGDYQIILSTGQFLGEGTDINNIDCLILAYPFSFEGKLIQYIGRVQRTVIAPVIYDYRDIYIGYLEKQFLQRNRYYRKLTNAGMLQKFDELLLFFNEDKVFVNSDSCIIPVSALDLPMDIAHFKEGIVWKIRVLHYDEETAELMTEIIDYNYTTDKKNCKQAALQFMVIDKINFRAIDTIKLLNAVALKYDPNKNQVWEPLPIYPMPMELEKKPSPSAEKTLSKTITIPFAKIRFLHAAVSFLVFIDELETEIKFEIENPDIRPEFEAIKEYFLKLLKKKNISVNINITHRGKEIISSTASSEDINKINNSIIDNVRFAFVKKEFLSFKGNREDSVTLNTIDSFLDTNKYPDGKIIRSEQELIDDLLQIKDSKHFQQLKYLSSQHLYNLLKIRFILQPFSFLFLLGGEKKYHLIWETLSSEEATYVWHFDKTMDALRQGLIEIEKILSEIKSTSKQDYLKKEHENFSRIIHDYGDVKSGFTSWKGMLEERLK